MKTSPPGVSLGRKESKKGVWPIHWGSEAQCPPSRLTPGVASQQLTWNLTFHGCCWETFCVFAYSGFWLKSPLNCQHLFFGLPSNVNQGSSWFGPFCSSTPTSGPMLVGEFLRQPRSPGALSKPCAFHNSGAATATAATATAPADSDQSVAVQEQPGLWRAAWPRGSDRWVFHNKTRETP